MKNYQKIEQYVEKFHMIEAGESVVVGVSGGADSICLLHFLKEYQKKMDFKLLAVHVHHGIREEAELDLKFVENICKNWEIPLQIFRYDIKAIAEQEHQTVEEAGRNKRYEAFHKVLEAQGKGKIAVAHHKNDQAETVLFQLFRGSGLKGMAAMSPVRECVIRPLLGITRVEIEEYIAENDLSYCQDITNFSRDYTRNKIRLDILPVASEINQQAIEHISKMAEMAEAANGYFERMASSYLKEHEKNGCLSVKELLAEDEIIQKYIIKACIQKVANAKKDISAVHVEAVLQLLQTTGNKQLKLPYRLIVKKSYDKLKIQKLTDVQKKHQLDGLVTMDIMENNWSEFNEKALEKKQFFQQNKYTKWFDYDKIDEECQKIGLSLKVRTREADDYIVINENGNSKKIKQYMIEAKIPKEKRNELPLLSLGDEILWVPGYRRCERFFVADTTKRVLRVRWTENKE